MAQPLTGGCLCGAVRYKVSGDLIFSGRCYCDDCRKTSGTGHNAVFAVPEQAVSITGKLTDFRTRRQRPAHHAPVLSGLRLADRERGYGDAGHAAGHGVDARRSGEVRVADERVRVASAELGSSARGHAIIRRMPPPQG